MSQMGQIEGNETQNHVLGLHLNWFPSIGSPLLAPIRFLFGSYFPHIILPKEREQQKVRKEIILVQFIQKIKNEIIGISI